MSDAVDVDELRTWLEDGYASSVRTAYLILGNRPDAEDAVQESFLRAWKFRDSLATGSSFKPWLYRVVVNACYSKLRQEIPHRDRRADDGALAHIPGPGSDPDTTAERSEVADTVLEALQLLPASLRVPVVLRYYTDLSEREIAQAIGRRPGTVKSRLHEARRRLKENPRLAALADQAPIDQPEEA